MDTTRELPDNLHIIQLESDKFKILDAILMNLSDKGRLIPISGPNGAGKSSLIDATHAALGGKSAMPAKPIKDGESEMMVRVTLGNGKDVALIVTRKATRKGDNVTHSLKVVTADGSEVASPQAILDAVVGDFTFDPLAFVYLKPKEQYEVLVELLGLSDTLDKLDVELKAKETERTLVGRDQKTFKGAVDTLKASLPADVPDKEVSIADLTAEYEQAQELHERKRDIDRRIAEAKDAIEGNKKIIAEYEEKIKLAKQRIKTLGDSLDGAEKEAADFALPDLDAIKAKLSSADQTNQAVRKLAEYKQAGAKFRAASDQYDALTKEIEALRKQPEELLRKSDIGIEGLAVRDGAVYLNDVPLDQCATSEQLVVGVKIGMMKNPTLRTMFIRDGSLVDSLNWQKIAEMCEQKDFQILYEKVDETGQVGFVINEGRIVREPEAVNV